MHTIWQDLRYGLRTLLSSPGFSAIAILTLALGIGANSALFSVVNGVLLNPLPYPEPNQLLTVFSRVAESDHWSISYLNFRDWQRENHCFAALAAYRQDDLNLTGMGEPERLPIDMVSAEFFPLLGVKPLSGRFFSEKEDRLGGAPVALISESFWKRKFASAPDVVGKPITLNAKVYTITGVIPAGFHFSSWNFSNDGEVFLPLGQWDDKLFQENRAVGMGMDAIGRLKPDMGLTQARHDMDSVAAHLAEIYPATNKNSGINLVPLKELMVGDARPLLLILLAAVGFVLLIACANVANLLLARSTDRTREFAIRTALGASRGRMIRQLLTESVLLALAGGLLGLLLAAWGTRAAIKLLPDALPRAEQIQLDARVVLFTLAISLLAGIVFGLIPAFKTSAAQIHETLKEGGRGGSGTRHRTQGIIVAVEMALALVLLTGAGLMIRSLQALWHTSPGFDSQNVFTFALSSSQPLGDSPAAVRSSFRQLHDAVAAVPGVQSVSLSFGSRPMQGDSSLPLWLDTEPKPATESDMKIALFYGTQPDYLKVMHIPLMRGRYFTDSDNENASGVVVIDEKFATNYFPGIDPIGHRIHLEIMNTTAEIIGVVGHVKQWGLATDITSINQAQCYFPLSQMPDMAFSFMSHGVQGFVRTDPAMLADTSFLARSAHTVNSEIVVYDIMPMTSIIGDSLATQRFAMTLLGIFAGLATLLSAVGIYGVISYIASQRTHEIGVRMALGAARMDVLRMMLAQASSMALIGVAVGLIAALALMRLMSSMLFGVTSHDPLTFAAVALLLTSIALIACAIPARRATRVDPMVALRYE